MAVKHYNKKKTKQIDKIFREEFTLAYEALVN